MSGWEGVVAGLFHALCMQLVAGLGSLCPTCLPREEAPAGALVGAPSSRAKKLHVRRAAAPPPPAAELQSVPGGAALGGQVAVNGDVGRQGEQGKAARPGAELASTERQVSDVVHDAPAVTSSDGIEASSKRSVGKRRISNGFALLEDGRSGGGTARVVGLGFGEVGGMRDRRCKLCRQEFEKGRFYVQCSTCNSETAVSARGGVSRVFRMCSYVVRVGGWLGRLGSDFTSDNHLHAKSEGR